MGPGTASYPGAAVGITTNRRISSCVHNSGRDFWLLQDGPSSLWAVSDLHWKLHQRNNEQSKATNANYEKQSEKGSKLIEMGREKTLFISNWRTGLSQDTEAHDQKWTSSCILSLGELWNVMADVVSINHIWMLVPKDNLCQMAGTQWAAVCILWAA